jgi:hypothetical protein
MKKMKFKNYNTIKKSSFLFKVLLFAFNLTLFTLSIQAQITTVSAPPSSVNFGTSVTVLPNGNYVVTDPKWNNAATLTNAGAVHLFNGSTHTLINSVFGSNSNDSIGSGGITVLSNGNFLIISPNGYAARGAVTWASSITGVMGGSGAIYSGNSLVGGKFGDRVGSGGITTLSNGNYVVKSPLYDYITIVDAGAVTWGNGTIGLNGTINTSNSLIGRGTNDIVGSGGITTLSNGNYVVISPLSDDNFNADVGAVTWGSGTTGVSGVVSSSNSLIGSQTSDKVGSGGITTLSNGNYVVISPAFDNGSIADAGAVTWGNGTVGVKGTLDFGNSLLGGRPGDRVGSGGVTKLSNGNYVVVSPFWQLGPTQVGAVTWGNGSIVISGFISSGNSLVGSKNGDGVGNGGITELSNGNYVVISPAFDNGSIADAGAITLGNGTIGVSGVVNSCNSVLGNRPSKGTNFVFQYDSIYNYLIVGKWDENKVYIYYSTLQALGIHLDAVTQNITGSALTSFVNSNCRIIASILPTGTTTAVSGSVTAKVWVETTQPLSYVKRHFEITPATNATTATGKVTLYFTQAEFDDFNAINATKLPTSSSDAIGKANLLIEKRPGISSDGTGLPSTYVGTPVTLNPADADIVWNATISRWEVSFDVTGFSGFFVKTQAATLPLRWLSVNGYLNSNKEATINWEVQETAVAKYEIEKSSDGRIFTRIGFINSKGNGTNNYTFTESTQLYGVNYYRIKQIDIDGKHTFSSIIKLNTDNSSQISIYPNPAKDMVTINGAKIGSNLMLTDLSGKIFLKMVVAQNSFTIDIRKYASGIYLLKTNEGVIQKIFKD